MQFLERSTLIEVPGGRTLEGLWHSGKSSPPVLLIPPMPGDGSMDSAVLAELAFALSQAGHSTLRFNFGGIGASQGSSRQVPELVDDASAALACVRESSGKTSTGPIATVAFASGARVAVALSARVADLTLVLISPPEDVDLETVKKSDRSALFVLSPGSPTQSLLGAHCASTGDRLEVVERADPQFNRGLPQLGKVVAEFLGT